MSLVAIIMSVSGCVILPIPTGTEPHHVFEQDTLDTLVGLDRNTVEARIGPPESKFGDEFGSFLIYRGGMIWEYFELVFPVVPPQVFIPYWTIAAASADDESVTDEYTGDTFCYLFEVDSNDILRKVQLKKGKDLDCRSAFFAPEQLAAYESVRQELRMRGSNEGDRGALEKLIKWFGDEDGDDLLREHLKSRFEQGDESYELRVELARLGFSEPLKELAWDGDLQASIDLYQITGKWRPLERLAELGDPVASARLKKYPRNPESMIKGLSHREFYENAERGDPDAQLQVYYDPNADDPLLWLCRAAGNRNPEAAFRLALLYENGIEGVTQDHVRARLWYRLAAMMGHPWGKANADRLAANFRSPDLEKVQRLLEQWQAGQCEVQLGFGGGD